MWPLPASTEDGKDPDPTPATQSGAVVPYEGGGVPVKIKSAQECLQRHEVGVTHGKCSFFSPPLPNLLGVIIHVTGDECKLSQGKHPENHPSHRAY